MTQLFDALTRGLIRRHLVSTRQVPSEYCMPQSLQLTKDISNLPPRVAQQLLQLARVAYKGLCKKRYVFTDLGEDFEHLGTMKKTTSVNVCTGPGCSYSFLHLTLQEYLTALHIAIVNPSAGFELVKWLREGSFVVRFLAGMCRHFVYRSHPVYQELVQLLATRPLQLVHCAYECPSIMHYIKRHIFNVAPEVCFECYTIGYCISHFNRSWGLIVNDYIVEGIDLLVKGLRSSPIATKRINFLSLSLRSLSQVMTSLREFCELRHLIIINAFVFGHDDEVILQQLIASGLLKLEYSGILQTETFIPLLSLLFKPSSLYAMSLNVGFQEITVHHELLPHENTNLEELTITRNLLHMIVNITSLTYLKITNLLDSDLPFLINIVKSHRTLEKLDIGRIIDSKASIATYTTTNTTTSMIQLIEAAGNIRLKKLRFCYGTELPPHIYEQYNHMLERWYYER